MPGVDRDEEKNMGVPNPVPNASHRFSGKVIAAIGIGGAGLGLGLGGIAHLLGLGHLAGGVILLSVLGVLFAIGELDHVIKDQPAFRGLRAFVGAGTAGFAIGAALAEGYSPAWGFPAGLLLGGYLIVRACVGDPSPGDASGESVAVGHGCTSAGSEQQEGEPSPDQP